MAWDRVSVHNWCWEGNLGLERGPKPYLWGRAPHPQRCVREGQDGHWALLGTLAPGDHLDTDLPSLLGPSTVFLGPQCRLQWP